MKKNYVKPTMVGERFVADEFVAACGDEHKVYKFECDAPGGPYYSDGDGDGEMELLNSGYYPCGATHEAPTDSVFKPGFIDYNKNGKQDAGEEVVCWLIYGHSLFGGTYVKNGHATTKLNMDEWETAKS